MEVFRHGILYVTLTLCGVFSSWILLIFLFSIDWYMRQPSHLSSYKNLLYDQPAYESYEMIALRVRQLWLFMFDLMMYADLCQGLTTSKTWLQNSFQCLYIDVLDIYSGLVEPGYHTILSFLNIFCLSPDQSSNHFSNLTKKSRLLKTSFLYMENKCHPQKVFGNQNYFFLSNDWKICLL